MINRHRFGGVVEVIEEMNRYERRCPIGGEGGDVTLQIVQPAEVLSYLCPQV